MRSFKLVLTYDGTAYSGWQVQPGRPTLQARLQAALTRVTGETIHAVASGRTDAGVHALGQVVSFSSATNLAANVLCRAINAYLPEDMSVLSVELAPPGFHAIRDATGKRYRYVLEDAPVPCVFRRQYCWHVHGRLDHAAMQRAAAAWLGEHDFRSFESHWPNRATSVRIVHDVLVRRRPPPKDGVIDFEVAANGFLYNMVRAMVGTLVQVGLGRRDEDWPRRLMEALDRSAGDQTAPPQGLFLVHVDYDGVRFTEHETDLPTAGES